MLPAGSIVGANYRPKHVDLIEIINKIIIIIIVTSSLLFILLHQWCTGTQTLYIYYTHMYVCIRIYILFFLRAENRNNFEKLITVDA